MEIEIRPGNLPVSEALRGHIERKLAPPLRRFETRIRRVVVRLVDLNGPRGGVDKRCRILARLSPSQVVVAEATDADAYVAVSQAALRLDDRVWRVTVRRAHARPAAPRLPDAAGALDAIEDGLLAERSA